MDDGALLAQVLAAAGYEIVLVDLLVPEMERTAAESMTLAAK